MQPVNELLFSLKLPARPERLVLVRTMVQRVAEISGCSEDLAQRLVIALNEACMNIIQHAYKGIEEGHFILEVRRKENILYFRLEDAAPPINLESVKSRELDDVRPGGLGVHFIHEIMDTCTIGHLPDGRGNYLEMTTNIK
jgi:anti-sigma regulatory factor (Ser/Thr protein kinase)